MNDEEKYELYESNKVSSDSGLIVKKCFSQNKHCKNAIVSCGKTAIGPWNPTK
jgi:hypothetical protein